MIIDNPAIGSATATTQTAGDNSTKVATTAFVTTAAAAYQPLDATLTALAALDSSAGYLVQTAADTFAKRTLTGTTNQISITNGTGTTGNPVFSLPQDIATTSTPTFLGLNVTGTVAATLNIDESGGGQQASIYFKGAGTARWQLGKLADNSFFLWDATAGRYMLTANTSGAMTLGVATFTTTVNGLLSVTGATTLNATTTLVTAAGNATFNINESAGGSTASVILKGAGTNRWELAKPADNSFGLWDSTAGRYMITANTSGALGLGVSGFTTTINGNGSVAGTLGVTGALTVTGASELQDATTIAYKAGVRGGIYLPIESIYGKPAIQAVTSGFAAEVLYLNPVGSYVGVGAGMSIGASYYTTTPPTNGAIIQGRLGVGISSLTTGAIVDIRPDSTNNTVLLTNPSASSDYIVGMKSGYGAGGIKDVFSMRANLYEMHLVSCNGDLSLGASTSQSIGSTTRNLTIQASTGYVGIGTNTPDTLLHVYKNQVAPTIIKVENPASSGFAQVLLKSNASTITINQNGSAYGSSASFATTANILSINGATTLLLQESSGNVGIRTSSPLAKLSIGDGSLTDTAVPAQMSAGGTLAYYGVNRTNGNYGALFGWDAAWGVTVRSVNSGDNIVFVVSSTTSAMTILPSGYVGISITNPSTILTIVKDGTADASSYGCINTVRSGTNTSNHIVLTRAGIRSWGLGMIYNSSTFGIFSGPSATDSSNTTAALAIDPSGNVLIGTTTVPTGTNGKVLVFADNAGNPTMGTNTAGFFCKDVAGTVEAFAVDEASNVTQLSPHNPETGRYYYHSENTKTGRVVNIDMEGFIKDYDARFGTSFFYENMPLYYVPITK